MADGAVPFGVTAGPGGEYVSLNTAVGREYDNHDNLKTYPIPSADPLAGWLTDQAAGRVRNIRAQLRNMGRLSPNGSIVEYPLPAGPDALRGERHLAWGSVYVAEQGSDADRPLNSVDGSRDRVPGPDGRRHAPRPRARPRRRPVLHGAERRQGGPRRPRTGRSVSGRSTLAPFPTGSFRVRMGPSGSPSSSAGSSAASRWAAR